MTVAGKPLCHWSWHDQVDYARALEWQEQQVVRRQQALAPDTLMLLQHGPVITLGRGAKRDNIRQDTEALSRQGVPVFETGRGGDVTYHGPGQVVGYPIIDLRPDRRDVHRYVRDLEEVLIRTAADYGIQADRVKGLTGIWVGSEKLAAIGVRISRWVTSHGFGFNVTTNLSHFEMIVPCGIPGKGVTSLRALLGEDVLLMQVAERLAAHFGTVYDRKMVRCSSTALLAAGQDSGQPKGNAR